ncbi:hypothetical protein VNO77_27262 [Canavalia gladiata]|uniref:Uncharacterized protein n=1 Tax=Canavalia gladiata TaxID=3824 RepID=A0AAN9KVG6_CANGL
MIRSHSTIISYGVNDEDLLHRYERFLASGHGALDQSQAVNYIRCLIKAQCTYIIKTMPRIMFLMFVGFKRMYKERLLMENMLSPIRGQETMQIVGPSVYIDAIVNALADTITNYKFKISNLSSEEACLTSSPSMHKRKDIYLWAPTNFFAVIHV